MVNFKGRGTAVRLTAIALLQLTTAWGADRDANVFAQKVYAITKTGDYHAYVLLMHPRCHASSTTPKNSFAPFGQPSFELRSDLLNRLVLAPGAEPEAMPFADYQVMMKKRGAPPSNINYKVPPSHIVIVRGTLPGVAGGDHVALNPIVKSDGIWRILDGDCLSAIPTGSHPKP
jgi:hypothetical protein